MPSSDVVEVSEAEFDEGPDKKSSKKLKQNVERKDGNKSFKELAKTGGVKEKGKIKRMTSKKGSKKPEQVPGP